MNTYDTDTRRLNVGTFWGNLRAVLRRWLDRERELVSLRNAVGMMSEARRADAAEWHDMREMNREMRADALRLRWLADDHADPALRPRLTLGFTANPAPAIATGAAPSATSGHGQQRSARKCEDQSCCRHACLHLPLRDVDSRFLAQSPDRVTGSYQPLGVAAPLWLFPVKRTSPMAPAKIAISATLNA